MSRSITAPDQAELLPSEWQEVATASSNAWRVWRPAQGIARIERVMSDNGPAYLSHRFRDCLKARGMRHLRTRPSAHSWRSAIALPSSGCFL